MADTKTLHCSLLTPDRPILDCDATFIVMPAHDGQIGFLKNRAPLLCKLGIGELRIELPEGRRRFFIDRGFAQMLDNELTILTQHAEDADKIDADGADATLKEALALTADDGAARTARDLAITRARARARIARPAE